jgi:site-specific DNA-methyltransferase (adenine-specific)
MNVIVDYIKQGDCLELMKDIPDASIDMILCDLPYGTTDCKWDSIIPFESLWEQYNRIIKDNGAIVLFSAQPFTTKLIHSNIKSFRYCWYWKKNNVTGFTFAKHQPMRCIEDICVFYKKMPTYNPQGLVKLEKLKKRQKKYDETKDTVYRGSTLNKPHIQRYTNYPKHLLEYKNDALGNKNRLHPTQKPVALLEYLIKTYTNEGDVVLDNCMGSGSTCVAAVNTNRHYIGFELDEKYFDIACKRLSETTIVTLNPEFLKMMSKKV